MNGQANRNALISALCLAMALGASQAAKPPEQPDRPKIDATLAKRYTQRFFKRYDKNSDEKITREELPQQMRGAFDHHDTNRDGAITPEEDTAYRIARADRTRVRTRPARVLPDHSDIKYGPHERNVFDLWLAKSSKPTPLVIYYHGGGFRGGDKRSINVTLLRKLLDGGVSVAAANYRLTNVAPFPAQMHDSARALQFIRLNSAKYNIDPKRVGATGGSAGAGISQWLAFHDDLADPRNADPVARQSTRISVAVVNGAQTSYDPRFIMKLFNTTKTHDALIAFYGMKSPEDIKNPKFHALFKEASPITHVSAGDAPVMLFYSQANKPLQPNSTGGQHIHHPKFGVVLKEKLDSLGIDCVVLFREDHPKGTPIDKQAAFFFKKLGVKPPR